MKIFDMCQFTLLNIKRRKSRSLLTMLGIGLGSALILLMVSFGIGSSEATNALTEDWGDLTLITIQNGGDKNGISANLFHDMQNNLHVLAATPLSHFSEVAGRITSKRNQKYTCDLINVTGIEISSMKHLGYELKSGVYSPQGKLGADIIPVVVSEYVAYEFFDSNREPDSPLYKRTTPKEDSTSPEQAPFFDIEKEPLILQIFYNEDDQGNHDCKEYELVVSGIIKSKSSGGQNAVGIYMDISDMNRIQNHSLKLRHIEERKAQTSSYSTAYVKVDCMENVDGVENELQKKGFQTSSLNDVRKNMQKEVRQNQLTFGNPGAIDKESQIPSDGKIIQIPLDKC